MIFEPYHHVEADALADVPQKPAAMEQSLRVSQGRKGVGS